MSSWQFGKDVIQTASASLAVLLALLGVVWAIGRRHFDAQVVAAIMRERERFYLLLVRDLLKGEMEMVMATHDRARRTHDLLERHTADFSEHRREIESHLQVLITIPGAVVRLTAALDRFDTNISGLAGKVQSHEVALKVLETASRKRGV